MAYQNTAVQLRRYKDTNNLLKIEWHVADAATTDEYEYLSNVRFLNVVRTIPAGEVEERMDFIFAAYGSRLGP